MSNVSIGTVENIRRFIYFEEYLFHDEGASSAVIF